MNELVKFDEVTAAIAEYKAENENLVFNYEEPQGNKDARSHIYKLRQVKTKIADIHKVAKAEALGVCRLLDSKKKELTGEVDEMIDVHYKPVKEIEEREVKAAAEKANAERLERIRVEAERVAETERREKELAEREAAAQAKEDGLARAAEKLEVAKQAEADKQAAVQAAQKAAGRDRVAAEAKAEQDKKDAQASAEAATQAAVEAEQEKARQEAQRIKDEAAKIAADLVAEEARIKAEAFAKQEREAKIEADRVANQEHRDKVEQKVHEVLFGIITYHVDDNEMKSHKIAAHIVTAIKESSIPHVTINY